ncbi:hypothetical protein QEN19_003512 [Hanseniaspora menglaensis]
MEDHVFSTPSKDLVTEDSLEEGLISLKLSNKKNASSLSRTRTNSRTDAVGRKQSLSPKKSMRFSLATNTISREVDEGLAKNIEETDISKEQSNSIQKTPIKGDVSKKGGNKLEFKQSKEIDMENLFLELAKRQRLVSELQIQLSEAERKLKEWENYCQNMMNGPENSSLNKSKANLERKNEGNKKNGSENGASDVFNRWTSKLKATTDEILALAHHASNETDESKIVESTPQKNEQKKGGNNDEIQTSSSAAAGFFQSSLGKFTDIIHEFYEDEEDEQKEKKELNKDKNMDNAEENASSNNIFDKLKNKLSEFTVYNEDEEREFDRSRARNEKVEKADSMDFELIDHSGVSIDGIHNYSGALSDSD